MNNTLNHLSEWDTAVRGGLTVALGIVALLAWVCAFRFSSDVGEGNSAAAITLLYSGWRMDTNEVLAGWVGTDRTSSDHGRSRAGQGDKARNKKLRSASWTFRFDILGSIALAAVLFGCAAVLRTRAPNMRMTTWGEAAAWLAVVSGVSSAIGDISLISVIRSFESKRRVSWLGISVAMTMLFIRVTTIGLAMLYVLAGTAAFDGSIVGVVLTS